MNYIKLCKAIDKAFENENVLVIVEGTKNGNNYFISQGKTKSEVSKNFINFKLKQSIKKMDFFLTII